MTVSALSLSRGLLHCLVGSYFSQDGLVTTEPC